MSRSNGDQFFVLVENTETFVLDTSGTKKIWIQVKQEAIDNGAMVNANGTDIADIVTGETMPDNNTLLLANITSGSIGDERVVLPKIQHLQTQLNDQQDSLSEVQSQVTELMSN